MPYLNKQHAPLTPEELQALQESSERLAAEFAKADAETVEAVQETFDLFDAWVAAGCPDQ